LSASRVAALSIGSSHASRIGDAPYRRRAASSTRRIVDAP